MLRSTDLSLRTALMGCRVQPSLSTAKRYQPTQHSSNQTPEHPNSRHHFKLSRPYSTTAPISTSSSTSTSASVPNDANLNWNTFFKLRKTRRRLQLGSSVGTSIISMLAGAQTIAVSDMEGLISQIPLDPFVTLGLATFACGGAGWLLGPTVGTTVFNIRNSKYRAQMDAKEKQFYERIKRFRVDPSASSMANPVPDYYGERIASVQGYRQWLKDQRAFNKKRQTFV